MTALPPRPSVRSMTPNPQGRPPVKRTVLTLALTLAALPAVAQTFQTEEESRAYALILPMLREMTDQMPGPSEYMSQILATCVVTHAEPAERAALAAAPGPSVEVGQVINGVLPRQGVLDCVKASSGG